VPHRLTIDNKKGLVHRRQLSEEPTAGCEGDELGNARNHAKLNFLLRLSLFEFLFSAFSVLRCAACYYYLFILSTIDEFSKVVIKLSSSFNNYTWGSR